MIVVDASALIAILQGELEAEACRAAIDSHDELLMSAPGYAEALIVATGRDLHGEMGRLLGDLAVTVVPLTRERALAAVSEYVRWGKGYHPAKLNFCDAFAYALAKEHDCPLLFVGNDFSKTDVTSALG